MSVVEKVITKRGTKYGLLDTGGVTVNLQDNSKKILELLNIATLAGLEKVGMRAETHAKEDYAPVDTGHLRNNINHEVDESEMNMALSCNVEYAAYQELGTRKMKAHPYLKPAIFNHTGEYKSILEDCLRNA